jgi:hypothetical protein
MTCTNAYVYKLYASYGHEIPGVFDPEEDERHLFI